VFVSIDNYIDGKEFLTLTVQEIKSMVPPIGLSRKIICLLPEREVTATLANVYCLLIYFYYRKVAFQRASPTIH
jgi:hypothetical protein